MSSAMFSDSAKLNGVISTLGPIGTDSDHEARKHCSNVELFPSFPAAAANALETGGYALVPAGYLDFQDGEMADSWVDLHFRLLGLVRIVDVWESPTKEMCLAINSERVQDRESIRSIALHPATAVFARQVTANAEISYFSSKPLAVGAAESGRVDACIGSVDVVASSSLKPVGYFRPTMVWILYESVQARPA